jgi:hypothetical protein
VGLAARVVDGKVNGRAAWLGISVAGIGGEVETSGGEAARRVDAGGPCWNAVGVNCNVDLPLASAESFQCSHRSSEGAPVLKKNKMVMRLLEDIFILSSWLSGQHQHA